MNHPIRLQDLERTALPAEVTVHSGQGGLPKLRIKNHHAEAEIYLQGAHVTHFQPQGQRPVLWISARSWFEADKPIRGGVPICWPWFGPHPSNRDLPAHGFARVKPWTLVRAVNLPAGRTQVAVRLCSDDQTRALWPHEFELEYTITVGPELELALRVSNPDSGAPFRCDQALHTYLAVSDVRQVEIRGLQGAAFIDKTQNGQTARQAAEVLALSAETDRVFVDSTSTCVVRDQAWGRELIIAKRNSNTTVVWNPWVAKARAMPDFGDDEWPGMLCVETANAVTNALTLAPSATHQMEAVIGQRPSGEVRK